MSARRGYTLVEVLVVVVILGIAGVVVVPHLLAPGDMGVQAATRMVVADLIYAQNEAVARQRVHKVVFDPENNRYELQDDDGPLQIGWRTSGSSDALVDFNRDRRFAGVELVSAEFGDESLVRFYEMGEPSTGGEIVLEYNDQKYRVRVAAFTGRVTVEKIEND